MTEQLTAVELFKQQLIKAEREIIPFAERSPAHMAAAKIMDMERQKHNQGNKVSHHLNYIRKIIESNIDELSSL